MLTIKSVNNETHYLSDDVYRIKTDGHPSEDYKTGKLVRLIGDTSDSLGKHFIEGWKTVCSTHTKVAEFCGIPTQDLELIDKSKWMYERSSDCFGFRCKDCATWVHETGPFNCVCNTKKDLTTNKTVVRSTPMKYAYQLDIQGNGTSHYLKFIFDRQISGQNVYRHTKRATAQELELMNAIANTPRVGRSHTNEFPAASGVELINLSGNGMTVKIIPIGETSVSEVVSQIVKKVQRRFAKGQGRQRVRSTDIDLVAAKINAKW